MPAGCVADPYDPATHLRRPPTMRRLLAGLADGGWRWAVQIGTDSGGDEFHSVEAARGRRDDGERMRVTWHSRATDGATLRLFSASYMPPVRGGWRQYLTAAYLIDRARRTPGEE